MLKEHCVTPPVQLVACFLANRFAQEEINMNICLEEAVRGGTLFCQELTNSIASYRHLVDRSAPSSNMNGKNMDLAKHVSALTITEKVSGI